MGAGVPGTIATRAVRSMAYTSSSRTSSSGAQPSWPPPWPRSRRASPPSPRRPYWRKRSRGWIRRRGVARRQDARREGVRYLGKTESRFFSTSSGPSLSPPPLGAPALNNAAVLISTRAAAPRAPRAISPARGALSTPPDAPLRAPSRITSPRRPSRRTTPRSPPSPSRRDRSLPAPVARRRSSPPSSRSTPDSTLPPRRLPGRGHKIPPRVRHRRGRRARRARSRLPRRGARARRGLKRFLYEQIRVAAAAGRRERERERDPSPDPDPEHNPSDPSAPWCVLEPCEGGWRVRDDCSLHLYATSAPCGNATVKRWAKGAKEKFRDDVGPFDVPRDLATHPPPSFGAKKDGQLAFLYKRDGAAGAASKDPGAERKDDARNPSSAGNPESSVAPGVVPAGTATVGRLLTCSDKIAVWSCVGVQGGLLLAPGLLTRPAYLASVVVGRKFGQAVLRRALCCRMRGFRGTRGMGRVPTEGADASGDAGAVAFALSHPAAIMHGDPVRPRDVRPRAKARDSTTPSRSPCG